MRKLRRLDLLELLVDQIRENEENEKTIEELTDLSERLKAKLDDKDVQIEHLKSRLSDKDVKIEHLKSRLNGKDVQIATLEKHLDIAPSSFVVFSPDVTVMSESASDLPESHKAESSHRAWMGADDLFRTEKAALADEATASSGLADEEDALVAPEEHDAVDLPVAEPLDVDEPATDEPLDVAKLAEESQEALAQLEDGDHSPSEPDADVQEAKQETPVADDEEAAEQASDEAPAGSLDSAQIIAEESEKLAEAVQAFKPAPEDFAVPAAEPLEELKRTAAPSEQKASDNTGQEAKKPPVIEKPSAEKPTAVQKPSVGDLPVIDEHAAEASSAKKPVTDSPSAKEKPGKKGKSAGRKGLFGSLPFFGKKARKSSPAVDAPKFDESSLPAIEAPAPSPAPAAGPSPAASSSAPSVKAGLGSLPDIDAGKVNPLSAAEVPAISP